ncbi:MAG: flagellar hook-basal body complex protein, partial [Pseudomonadota bacterium]
MSLSSSLNAGVMGLNVNSAKLATISNTVANSSPPGYKRVEATFSSLVLQQRRNAYAAGGVRVDTTKLVNERGSLVTTGSSTDISIGGQGMLPVTDTAGVNQPAGSRSLFFTPTGDFAVDQNGLLVSSTGLHLMGWPADA